MANGGGGGLLTSHRLSVLLEASRVSGTRVNQVNI